MFILPPGGGGAESYFNNIAPILSQKYKLVLFNNYILYLREKLASESVSDITYEKLASEYICYIKSIQSKGPYNFLGWSFGGVLAFEITRQLLLAGEDVTNLMMIDSYFDYKNVADKVGVQDINYRYNQKMDQRIKDTNVLLFKASEVEAYDKDIPQKERDLVNYYLNTEYNNLEKVLKIENVERHFIKSGHESWIQNPQLIKKIARIICNVLVSSTY